MPNTKPAERMWYKDWFRDANYLVVYEHRDDLEADQMMDLIQKHTGGDTSRRVLDLGCGSGRHSISFARQGYQEVTGIDLSPTLLAEAEENSALLGLKIRFLERDMRNLPEEKFDLIVNLFTSFGYFLSDDENEQVIKNVGSALNEGGYFVLDFLNSHWVRSHLVAHDERILPDGQRLEQTRWIQDGRVEKRLLIRRGEEADEYIESVRLYELKDFEAMFENAGLKLEHVFGSYSGEAFSEKGSNRLIMFAKK